MQMRAALTMSVLGALVACSTNNSAVRGLEPGEVVIGKPVPPDELGRLGVAENVELVKIKQERSVMSAAEVLAAKFSDAGLSRRDAEDAVASFVIDPATNGKQILAVAREAQTGGAMASYTRAVRRMAEAGERRGLVQVFTQPAEVLVVLGGEARGLTQTEFWCSSGRHQLTLEKAGYKSRTVTLTVEPQRITRVTARMEGSKP